MSTATLLCAIVWLGVPTPGDSQGEERASIRGPAILDFHSDSCLPCRKMRPVIRSLKQGRFPVQSINADENPSLVKRYNVDAVPAFVVVDRFGNELDRVVGLHSANDLAEIYNQAVSPQIDDEPNVPIQQIAATTPARSTKKPAPWATVVRITVHDRMLGFGSGTIIESRDDEAIILTCAHIFKIDRGPQPPAKRFNLPIKVEMFDGIRTGPRKQMVRPLGPPVPAKLIDYDFDRDVALVRMKTDGPVPASPIVPTYWKPEKRMEMYTVGCSHGKDATAWNTVILNPAFMSMPGKSRYQAIECLHSPRRGRSGGGLYTTDGYVAGVCNFAFQEVSKGLYASPKSIYAILDRNNLSYLYNRSRQLAPRSRPQQVIADGRTDNFGPENVVRGQSPTEGPLLKETLPLTIPDPRLAGVRMPDGSLGRSNPQPISAAAEKAETNVPKRSNWRPKRVGTALPSSKSRNQTYRPISRETSSETISEMPNPSKRFDRPSNLSSTSRGNHAQTDQQTKPSSVWRSRRSASNR